MVDAKGAPKERSSTGRHVAEVLALSSLSTPMAIRVAATLKIPDLIAQGEHRAERLASASGADPGSLLRLMRHLATVGILAERPSGGFELTELGETLRSDHPSGLRPWLDATGALGRSDLAFFGLLETVRTGRPAYEGVFGRPFWDDLSVTPELGDSFDTLMASERGRAVGEIAEAVAWAAVSAVVDVGGGTGRQLARIVKGNPDLQGVLVDLPATAAAAGRYFVEEGIASQCSTAAGSFFEPLPPDADLYLLSFVLHDWSDTAAARILRRCADAVARNGRVVIVEHVLDDAQMGRRVTGMDMRMMTTFGGRERALSEYAALAETAGLKVERAQPIPSGASVIECVPAA
ncbi:methyltransferase [Streptomyces avidinii]|uniref:methyltransferase n=1 Tax=Streptomyces avidinii TaxID=1895 RepID=UPI00386B7922|nr:methyltransferase [Streptomyces avidinii]